MDFRSLWQVKKNLVWSLAMFTYTHIHTKEHMHSKITFENLKKLDFENLLSCDVFNKTVELR